eukprot:426659-Pleurochrysis_carterae.AAC.2
MHSEIVRGLCACAALNRRAARAGGTCVTRPWRPIRACAEFCACRPCRLTSCDLRLLIARQDVQVRETRDLEWKFLYSARRESRGHVLYDFWGAGHPPGEGHMLGKPSDGCGSRGPGACWVGAGGHTVPPIVA